MNDKSLRDLQLRQNVLDIANQLAATGVWGWQVDQARWGDSFAPNVDHYVALHKGSARVSLSYQKWSSGGELIKLRACTTEGDEFGCLICRKSDREFTILKDAYLAVAATLEAAAPDKAGAALSTQQTRINKAKGSLGL